MNNIHPIFPSYYQIDTIQFIALKTFVKVQNGNYIELITCATTLVNALERMNTYAKEIQNKYKSPQNVLIVNSFYHQKPEYTQIEYSPNCFLNEKRN